MRGATRVQGAGNHEIWISIHAPHAGSDADTLPAADIRADFNPRSPCGERRGGCEVYVADDDFNPRSPCGERRMLTDTGDGTDAFQSTLPMRGATGRVRGLRCRRRFQSTLPMRGATRSDVYVKTMVPISIHAPHAGSDTLPQRSRLPWQYFNPRSPCGERPFVHHFQSGVQRFQSTLPMRGATITNGAYGPAYGFQSTLPMRGATSRI